MLVIHSEHNSSQSLLYFVIAFLKYVWLELYYLGENQFVTFIK